MSGENSLGRLVQSKIGSLVTSFRPVRAQKPLCPSPQPHPTPLFCLSLPTLPPPRMARGRRRHAQRRETGVTRERGPTFPPTTESGGSPSGGPLAGKVERPVKTPDSTTQGEYERCLMNVRRRSGTEHVE